MSGHASSASCPKAAAHQIRDPNRHAARRIERKVLESEGRIERPHIVIQRMREHAEAADLLGQAHRRCERIEHQRSRDALPLPPQVDRQLAQQDGGQRRVRRSLPVTTTVWAGFLVSSLARGGQYPGVPPE